MTRCRSTRPVEDVSTLISLSHRKMQRLKWCSHAMIISLRGRWGSRTLRRDLQQTLSSQVFVRLSRQYVSVRVFVLLVSRADKSFRLKLRLQLAP